MKKKVKGIVKGAPSGFVISLMIHAAAFMLAGLLVVFNVVQKEEKKFVPPKPVDRPKMKLKKPKVKVKKSAKPKSTTRIVTKVKRASMPDIQLPEMSGMGDGLAGGIGGFDIMPDLEEVTLFGGGQTIGNDFVGTFYDLKRGRTGRNLPPMERDDVLEWVAKLIRNDWRPSTFTKFYRSPRKLYTTTFMIPPTLSSLAPEAFGEGDTLGYSWLAHYKGQLVYPEDIKIRFWGRGDDILVVRVEDEIVLEGSWPGSHDFLSAYWPRTRADSEKYILGFSTAIVGDWIELKAGESLDMQVLIGEVPGGVFQSMLCVEVEGEEYPRNPVMNGPTLPMFKTEEPSDDLVDVITYHLAEGAVSVRGGPVFCDFAVKKKDPLPETMKVSEPVELAIVPDDSMRIWTTVAGKTVEAEFLSEVGGKVTLKNSRGKQVRLGLAELSEEDRVYIALATPPKFDIRFLKRGKQAPKPEDSPFISNPKPYRGTDYVFGAEIIKKGSKPYNHELTVEYFVFANEADGRTYRMVERNGAAYVPSIENEGTLSISGESIRLEEYAMNENYSLRGTSYGGYLILLRDKTGKIIQYETSHERLFENRDKLEQIPVGKWFNKNCERIGPPRPGSKHRPDWMS